MTSANVTHYTVINAKTGEKVGEYRQHHYCKNTVKDNLAKHTPASDFTIKVVWPDEDEVDQIVYEGSLEEWFSRGKPGSKKYYWIRRDVNGIVTGALSEECYFQRQTLADELKIMASEGPIERIRASKVTIGEVLSEKVERS